MSNRPDRPANHTMQHFETVYRGHRFRSRTEARWAVFFDTLKMAYTYEPEGYQLASGGYLPDMFIDAIDAFFEIKGPQPTPEEIQLARELSEGTHKNVFIAWGSHSTGTQMIRLEPNGTMTGLYRWTHCTKCESILPQLVQSDRCTQCGAQTYLTYLIKDAHSQARGARFNEHNGPSFII